MDEQRWLDLLSSITKAEPADIDAELPTASEGRSAKAFQLADAPPRPPSHRLWDAGKSGMSFIGVRISEPIQDCTLLAARLAASALERKVIPILLSTIPRTGLERFGFRVERISGATAAERDVVEAELVSFWNLAIIIDAKDALRLK